MNRRAQEFCPFVDQTELVERMRADLRRIRGRQGITVYTEDDAAALELLERWITAITTELGHRPTSVDELQRLAQEWRTRRVRFFGSEAADVIVVER